MATAVRSHEAAQSVRSVDELSSKPTAVSGRIVVSDLYALDLEICEQTTPICGWVIVASRGRGRLIQLRSVYTSEIHAEAAAHMLAGRWARKFGKPASDIVPIPTAPFWELEWGDPDASSCSATRSEGLTTPGDLSATVSRSVI